MSHLLPILNDNFTPSSLSILQQLFLLSSQIAIDFLVSVKNTAIQKRISTRSLAIHTHDQTLCLLSVTLECVLPRKLPPAVPQPHSLSLLRASRLLFSLLALHHQLFSLSTGCPVNMQTCCNTYHLKHIHLYFDSPLFSVSIQNYLKKLSIQLCPLFLLNSLSVLNHTSRIDPVKVTTACKLLNPMDNLQSSL